jgi:hypothetical protein
LSVRIAMLSLPLFDQGANGAALERRDPADPLLPTQGLDRILRDHPPVSDHDQLRYTEVITQTIDLWQQDLWVCSVTGVDRHRHRAAPRIGEQTLVDLRLALLAIAAVAELSQRTGCTFEITRREIEHDITHMGEAFRSFYLYTL